MARRSASTPATQGDAQATTPARPNKGHIAHDNADHDSDFEDLQHKTTSRAPPYDPSLLPNGSRSLSSISLQAFFLGFTLAGCVLCTVWLVGINNQTWRLPAFFASLSLFHFLEFWTTARFNPPAARASSFLLFDNGKAYNVAHTLAAIEVVVSNFLPSYQSLFVNGWAITTGILLILLGQAVRSVAMAQAGTNFNHTPQKVRREGHELVTTGIYGWLRHPSYFGFFWWALGTQVLVGNKVCLIGYAFVLWNFFKRRIMMEELTLVAFFGADYEVYQKQTRVGIPLIR